MAKSLLACVQAFLFLTVISLPLPPPLHQYKLILREFASNKNFELALIDGLQHLDGLLEELSQQDDLSRRNTGEFGKDI